VRTKERVDNYRQGLTDGWTHGWMNGWMDGSGFKSYNEFIAVLIA